MRPTWQHGEAMGRAEETVEPNWRLRRERKLRGWTHDDLADQLCRSAVELGEPHPGVDRNTVGRWERGIRHPQLHYVRLLCHVFQLSAEQLGLVEEIPEEHESVLIPILRGKPYGPLSELVDGAIRNLRISHNEAVRRINQAANEGGQPSVSYTRWSVTRWLQGVVPQHDALPWLSIALQIPMDQLTEAANAQKMARRQVTPANSQTATLPTVDSAEDMKRRQFLMAIMGLAASSSADRLHLPLADLDRLDDALGAARKFLEAGDALSQLPPDIPNFTGRTDEIDQIMALLDKHRTGHPPAVAISSIAGKGGVGKTALAVHVAHRARELFPGGQLFINLHNAEGHPLDPTTVLEGFLRALGVDPRVIPDELEERSRMYRSRLQGRRLLIVLDNAANETQVRPLLPGSPECAVLVTSRFALGGLDTLHHVGLDVLAPSLAVQLLTGLVGNGRVAAEPMAAELICRLCGYLPLAVRVAAAKLTIRRHWRLERLAERLDDERRRLSQLRVGDLDVRACIALSYDGRGRDEQRLFRLLSMLDSHDFTVQAAAAVLDTPRSEATEVLEKLVDAQLVDFAGYDALLQPRYRLHDLVRLFGRERLEEESSAEQTAALSRTLRCYLTVAGIAGQRIHSGRLVPMDLGSASVDDETSGAAPAARQPLDWFEAERANLLALINQAYRVKLWEPTWQLVFTLLPFFEIRSAWSEWEHTGQLAFSAAGEGGSRRAERASNFILGSLNRDRSDFQQARQHLEAAVNLSRDLGDQLGEAEALLSLGIAHQKQYRLDDAMDRYEQCLPLFRALRDREGEAYTLREIGVIHRYREDFDMAAERLRESLGIFRHLNDRRGEAYALVSLGITQEHRNETAAAGAALQQALVNFRDLEDRRWEAYTLRSIGDLQRRQQRFEQALSTFEDCLAVFRDLGDRRWEANTLGSLGDLHAARQHYDRAAAAFNDASVLFDEMGVGSMADALRLRQGEVLQAKQRSAG
jgi:tetratricopeptide (TPR) repeat protein/transcriptional regulator with XRE-family HTH domain